MKRETPAFISPDQTRGPQQIRIGLSTKLVEKCMTLKQRMLDIWRGLERSVIDDASNERHETSPRVYSSQNTTFLACSMTQELTYSNF